MTTALIPLDPAVSPQQATRILPIRANLMPPEITAGRSARRTRIILIAAVVVVIALMGGWSWYTVGEKTQAADDLATVTTQADDAKKAQNRYQELTTTLAATDTLDTQLKGILTNDLPWATMLDRLSAAAAAIPHTSLSTVTSTLASEPTSAGTAAVSGTDRTVASLSISGFAPDKKTIARYVDAVGRLDGVANAFLTTASQDDTSWSFTLTASITAEALCGRYTTKCTTGGN